MNLARIFEETKSDAVNRCIAPALIEEATSAVKMVKVILIDLAAPELHVCDFKVAPEMARRKAMSLFIVIRSTRRIRHPLACAIVVDIVGVISKEFLGLGPNRGHRLRIVV